MGRLIAARGNQMPVQIEDRRLDPQLGQTRFFLGLAQGDPCQIAVAIGMAAQLQPAIELAVMRQQYALAIGTDQPG